MRPTLNLNLIFQFYSKTNLSPKDYFSDILASIEPEYPHKASETRTLYIPVEYDDWDKVAKNGIHTVQMNINNVSLPHYVIKELVVTFEGLGADYADVRDHLIEKFGQSATKYQIIEDGILNDPV